MTAKTLPQQLSRVAVYAVLLLAAAFFLAPLYVCWPPRSKTQTKFARATCSAARQPEL